MLADLITIANQPRWFKIKCCLSLPLLTYKWTNWSIHKIFILFFFVYNWSDLIRFTKKKTFLLITVTNFLIFVTIFFLLLVFTIHTNIIIHTYTRLLDTAINIYVCTPRYLKYTRLCQHKFETEQSMNEWRKAHTQWL